MPSRIPKHVRLAVASAGIVVAVFAAALAASPHPPATAMAVTPATWPHNPAASIGPQHWGLLDPAWTACASTEGQSPVVVTTAQKVRLPELRVDYPRTPLIVENTGHVVEVPQPAALKVGDHAYRLQQWHIHAPAEHVVNGQRADLEIHLSMPTPRDTTGCWRSSPTFPPGTAGLEVRRPRTCSAPSCTPHPARPARRKT
ncbi:MAG TPA: carbonic anhydrase family protein [Propionibacteriaceae bacterium]